MAFTIKPMQPDGGPNGPGSNDLMAPPGTVTPDTSYQPDPQNLNPGGGLQPDGGISGSDGSSGLGTGLDGGVSGGSGGSTNVDNNNPVTEVIITDREKLLALLKEGTDLLDGGMTLDDLQKNHPDIARAMNQEYGYALSFVYSDPELLRLFSKALRSGLTADGFKAELQGTNWWKDRTASQREYDLHNKTPGDAKTLEQRHQEIMDQIKSIAMEQNGLKLDDAAVSNYATDFLRNHFNDGDLTGLLTKFVRKTFVDSGEVFKFGGQAAATIDDLRKYANDMGVFMGDAALGNYVDKIFAEETTDVDVKKMIQDSAIGYYSQFADRIKAGETVHSIISPYRQMIASMLEMPDPEQINFVAGDGTPNEHLLQKALFGGPKGTAMSLYDLQKTIKQDSRWLKTANARSEYTNLAQGISRMFGGV